MIRRGSQGRGVTRLIPSRVRWPQVSSALCMINAKLIVSPKAHSDCRHLRVLRASPASSAPKFFLRDAANRQLRNHRLGTGVVSLGAIGPPSVAQCSNKRWLIYFTYSTRSEPPETMPSTTEFPTERLLSRCIRDRLADRLTEPDDRSGLMESLH
jgi:hypothetical protein